MPPTRPKDALERLRSHRVRPDFDGSLHETLSRQAKDLERTHKRLGNAAAAWGRVCPPEFLSRTAIVGLNRGVLTIRVRDASTRYELDRMLRAGGETAVLRSVNAPIRKIKLVVGA